MENNLPWYINTPKKLLPENLTHSILKSSNSIDFHRSLEQYKPTPLVELQTLARQYGLGNIYVKDESFRFGLKAFKGLGASYAIHKILEKEPEIHIFCTATDGNHGRAVAWSAKLLNRKARIFVPEGTTNPRIEAIKNEGAAVEVVHGNYEQTCAYAQKMAEENGWTLVQDTASENYEEIPAHIMAGYFTHFKELEKDLHSLPFPEIDVVFLQSGVGSWPAAAAWYYTNRYGKNSPKIVIVEPTEAAGMLASFKNGVRCSPKGSYKTMMAGLNCGIPSTSAWEIIRNTADASIAVEDEFMERAIKQLYFPEGEDERILSGESGVGGFAGFIAVMTDERFADVKKALGITAKTKILCYSTEGATDPENFQIIVSS